MKVANMGWNERSDRGERDWKIRSVTGSFLTQLGLDKWAWKL